ncbi:MAG: DNA-binding protein [Alphaproteobacteria bacterium]|nr:MAG: DNA-binding protein [Alphaproteobacteria bacterium]
MNNQSIADKASPATPVRRVHSLVEAAAILRVSRQTLYNLQRAGELRISKILGKSVVFDEDLEAFIEASKVGRI